MRSLTAQSSSFVPIARIDGFAPRCVNLRSRAAWRAKSILLLRTPSAGGLAVAKMIPTSTRNGCPPLNGSRRNCDEYVTAALANLGRGGPLDPDRGESMDAAGLRAPAFSDQLWRWPGRLQSCV